MSLFFKNTLPIHSKVGSNISLEFGVFLTSGEIAENVYVGIFAPPSFSFPGLPILIQDSTNLIIPNFVSARIDYGAPVLIAEQVINKVTIKVSDKTGQYKCYYQIMGNRFASELLPFDIIVD